MFNSFLDLMVLNFQFCPELKAELKSCYKINFTNNIYLPLKPKSLLHLLIFISMLFLSVLLLQIWQE